MSHNHLPVRSWTVDRECGGCIVIEDVDGVVGDDSIRCVGRRPADGDVVRTVSRDSEGVGGTSRN